MGKYDDLFDAAPSPSPAAVGKYSDLFDESVVVATQPEGGGVSTAGDEHDLLYYKTGKTRSEREALNAPLREAMQVPAVSPETMTRVLQALNTTDEQGPVQQGIDEAVSKGLSSMTTGEGATSAPLYMFPPTAAGVSAENVEQIPSQVGEAAQKFAEGDVRGGAGATTEAALNALTAAGVAHGRVPFVGEGAITPLSPVVDTAALLKEKARLKGIAHVSEAIGQQPHPTTTSGIAQIDQQLGVPPEAPAQAPPLEVPPEPYTQEAAAQRAAQPQAAPQEIGVAERYREEQQPGSVTPGTVQDAAHWRGKGREYISAGGDPRMPIRAAQAGHVSPRNVGIVSAQYELLAEQTQSAAQALQANPGNPQAVAALDNASRAQAAWSTEMQPVFTRASESLSAIQGKLPVDETTFAGMYDKALELNGGRPLPKPQQAELVRRSAKAGKARSAERQTYAKMDRAVPGRAPTDAEMQARVQDMVKRLTPC